MNLLFKKYILILSICATIVNSGVIYFVIAHCSDCDIEIVVESESDADYGEEEMEALDSNDYELLLASEASHSIVNGDWKTAISNDIFLNVVTPPPEVLL